MNPNTTSNSNPKKRPRALSVLDYPTDQALENALQSMSSKSQQGGPSFRESLVEQRDVPEADETKRPFATVSRDEDIVSWECADWRIENVGDDAVEQSLEYELQRLKVLKSYALLEGRSEQTNATLDRITTLGARLLQTPLCLVSLIDLGRSVVINCHGPFPEEVKLQDRRDSICSYAILSKTDFLIVPDASQDERFKDLKVVKNKGGVRFYAGVVLRSPEGYNLGAIAVVSPHPRPEGLSESEQDSFRDLAQLAVDAFACHKQIHMQQHQLLVASKRLASASHDLTTPLSAIQLALSLLHGDAGFQARLGPSQKDLVSTIASCSTAMGKVCEVLRTQHLDQVQDETAPVAILSSLPTVIEKEVLISAEPDIDEVSSVRSIPTLAPPQLCDVAQVVAKIHEALATLPAKVPVAVSIEPRVPPSIVCNDLQLFRILLDLLAFSCERTVDGSIHLTIRLARPIEEGSKPPALLVECKDSGPAIMPSFQSMPIEPRSKLHRLEFVTATARQVGGASGVRDCSGEDKTHSTCFWVTFPYTEPPELSLPSIKPSVSELSMSSTSAPAGVRRSSHRSSQMNVPTPNRIWSSGMPKAIAAASSLLLNPFAHENARGFESVEKSRRALVIDDSLVVRKVLSNALSQLGFDTEQAVDGMEGLRKMQSKRFSLVLCDFLMPVMDGMDCVREYRRWECKNRPQFEQYIIGMSAHASDKDVKQGLSVGMNDYRCKPVTLDVLKCLKLDMQGMARCESTETMASARKRRCASPTTLRIMPSDHDSSKACLLATTDQASLIQISNTARQCGWNVIFAESGDDAMLLLKRRNWGVVLLDTELVSLANIGQFREWEGSNRVHRQNNVFLLSSDLNPISTTNQATTFVQVPDIVDGAFNKPPGKEDLEGMFRDALGHHQNFQATDIIIR